MTFFTYIFRQVVIIDYLKCKYYYIPVKESEIQSAEETQEDVGIDEDWLPGNEELALEKEEGKEERVGAENGREVVDSEVDKSEEEENQMERGMEDQDLPAVADKDRDNCVNEGDVSNRNHHQ